MIFNQTPLPGVFQIKLEKLEDERGFFARSFDLETFKKHSLNPAIVQSNISFNKKRGTVRGMHFQKKPHEETRIVSCTAGSIFDVVIDLRPDSPTFKQTFTCTLSAENREMLYVPEGCAHGFQTLEDNTEVQYQMGQVYEPESSTGVRWDDPSFKVKWPLPISIISEKDKSYSNYV